MSQSESSGTVIVVIAVVLLALLLPCLVGGGLLVFLFMAVDSVPTPADPPPMVYAAPLDERATVEVVREITADQMGVDVEEIRPATSLSELGADELDAVELVMSLEDEFQISIPDEVIFEDDQAQPWSAHSQKLTISRLAEIVDQQRANKP